MIKEARIREEWRAEYMQTLVHDKDVYRDGFDEGFSGALIEVYNKCVSMGMSKE